MSFIDEIKIFVQGGDGGNGNLGYIKKSHKKIPYGGRGGKGGDIYIQADNNINNFNRFKFQNRFKALNGCHGDKNCRTGKKGKDLFIKVPLWTQIYCLNRKYILATLSFNKQKILIAKGGNYGLGIKRDYLGQPGESFELLLRLILKNDITILGLPNVGKSTLFNILTKNFSKIDSYPYTTDIPYLGTLETNITVLDLPNVIEKNILNYRYFKHLQYSQLILFVYDTSYELIKLYRVWQKIKFSINKEIWLIFNKIKDSSQNIIINILKILKIKERYYFIYEKDPNDNRMGITLERRIELFTKD